MPDTTKTDEAYKRLHLKVQELIMNNYTEPAIMNELKKEGIEFYYAQVLIENVQNDKADKTSFRYSLIMGICYIISGLILNFLSYKIAAISHASFFYVFWGIIVFGLITIIRGFILYRK